MADELNGEQLEVVTPPVEEEVVLPSNENEFVMPDKFEGKTAEEIAKSYIELEKLKNEAPKEQETEVIKPNLEVVQEYISKASGEGLTEDHYTELADKGFSKEQVDTYAAGIEAQYKAEGEKILTSIGTTETEYNQASAYMQANWDPARLSRFNDAVTNASADVLPTLLESALTEYRQATGNRGPILETKTIGQSDGAKQGYKDNAEFYKDMADPRYGKDAKFMAAVEAKMAISGSIF